MELRFLSNSWMDVCAARSAQTAFCCPSPASRMERSRTMPAILLDTMLMVSIFVFLILPGLIWAIRLSILAAIILLVIRLVLHGTPLVPNEQPLFTA